MNTYFRRNKQSIFYLLKFGGLFCIFYFGTLAIIGLSTPENQYSPFVAHYLNFIDPLRASVLAGAKFFLSGIGYESTLVDRFTLALQDGNAVRMVYSCIGYGVMSFWSAFILANSGTPKRKIGWLLGGLLMLWIINVLRIGLLLIASEKHWQVPFGWDHHTLFNVIAYSGIFLLIFLYDKSLKSTKQSLDLSPS
jgi:exosortase/archaeosortase family protein